MWIPAWVISLIICYVVWCFLKELEKQSIRHKLAVIKKNTLIKEAQSVKDSFNGVGWNEMNKNQKNIYNCAIERLCFLESFKKNQAPDDIENNYKLEQWPYEYNEYKKEINKPAR